MQNSLSLLTMTDLAQDSKPKDWRHFDPCWRLLRAVKIFIFEFSSRMAVGAWLGIGEDFLVGFLTGFLVTFVFWGSGDIFGILESGSKSESESLSIFLIFLEFCFDFFLLQVRELFGCFPIGHEHFMGPPGLSGLFSCSGQLLEFWTGFGSSVVFFLRPGIL